MGGKAAVLDERQAHDGNLRLAVERLIETAVRSNDARVVVATEEVARLVGIPDEGLPTSRLAQVVREPWR